ncbi:MAG: aminotransferase class IV [Chthoniobacterales bacterium]
MENNLTRQFDGERWQDRASVSLADRGFRFGMHVFETLAVRAGKIHHLTYHAEALQAAARTLGAETDFILKALLQFEKQSPLPRRDGTLRFFFTAGQGAPASPVCEPHLLAWFEPEDLPSEQPVLRVALKQISSDPFFLEGIKSGNYAWRCKLAAEASAAGLADWVLFAGRDKRLISCTMSNLAIRLGNHWVTPNAGSGCRAGVVRRYLLEQGWIAEGCVKVSDMENIEAAMLFNSRKGLCPIGEWGGKILESDERVSGWNEIFWREGY